MSKARSVTAATAADIAPSAARAGDAAFEGDHFDHGVIILITFVIKMITWPTTRARHHRAQSQRQSPESQADR
jgi:hypothetical protein